MVDMVNHPPHYLQHPKGIECIEVVEDFSFNVGTAIKYLWRHKYKNNVTEDLKKAAWYVNREIERIKKAEEREAERDKKYIEAMKRKERNARNKKKIRRKRK